MDCSLPGSPDHGIFQLSGRGVSPVLGWRQTAAEVFSPAQPPLPRHGTRLNWRQIKPLLTGSPWDPREETAGVAWKTSGERGELSEKEDILE
ncbi:hypothetical protein CapIbe_000895 [Capra ibex]